MSKRSFEKFVNQQIARSEDSRRLINRDAELAEWQSSLELLYRIVEGYLREFISQGKICLRFHPTQIREEFLGEYTVRSLEIEIATTSVRLEPIGTYLVGIKGRVDMIGAKGTIRIVLVDKESTAPKVLVTIGPDRGQPRKTEVRAPEWTWKIATDGARIRYLDLTADSFFSALMEVSRG